MPSEEGTQNEQNGCRPCGARESSDERLIVGEMPDFNDTICNECRAEELRENTSLSKLEAEVAALKQLDNYSNDEIAEAPDRDQSVIDNCDERLREQVEEAAERSAAFRQRAERIEQTASELRGLY